MIVTAWDEIEWLMHANCSVAWPCHTDNCLFLLEEPNPTQTSVINEYLSNRYSAQLMLLYNAPQNVAVNSIGHMVTWCNHFQYDWYLMFLLETSLTEIWTRDLHITRRQLYHMSYLTHDPCNHLLERGCLLLISWPFFAIQPWWLSLLRRQFLIQ